VRLLTGGTLGALLGLCDVGRADAAHFGCRHRNKRCLNDDECCSGICRGSGKVKRCRAHHVGTCTIDNGFCRTGNETAARCGTTGGCHCNVTTGKAPHCGSAAFCPPDPCKRDSDCGEPGAACIEVGVCNGCGSQDTENFCQLPCRT
jgi:hypothetical protein